MKQLDEIIYDAIKADATLMTAIGGHVISTCFEVSPGEADNTPVPYLIVTLDGEQNNLGTKDTIWEGPDDSVRAGVEVAGTEPREVKRLVRMVRRAVERYVVNMYQTEQINDYDKKLQLDSLVVSELAWDWMKPCYFQNITYSATTNSNIDNDEQEE